MDKFFSYNVTKSVSDWGSSSVLEKLNIRSDKNLFFYFFNLLLKIIGFVFWISVLIVFFLGETSFYVVRVIFEVFANLILVIGRILNWLFTKEN
jgi:hypothetical protein